VEEEEEEKEQQPARERKGKKGHNYTGRMGSGSSKPGKPHYEGDYDDDDLYDGEGKLTWPDGRQ
jgi:hypothetical protein